MLRKKLKILGSPRPLYSYNSLSLSLLHMPLHMPYRFFRTTITGTLRGDRAKKRSSASFEATKCLKILAPRWKLWGRSAPNLAGAWVHDPHE